MPPKDSKDLAEQVRKQNERRPSDDHSLTAEGRKVPNPTRGEFFSNLARVSKPEK
jgi:hypothetical protein